MLRLSYYFNAKVIRNHLYISQFQIFTRNYSDDKTKDKDLYDVLGLKSSATHSEIKKAYYDLTFKYHPDKNEGNAEASTKFREVSEAYEVLGNYGLKKRYDKGLPLPLLKTKSSTARGIIVEKDIKYQKFFDSRASAQKIFEQNRVIEEDKPPDDYYSSRDKRLNDQFEKSKSLQTPTLIFVAVLIIAKIYYDL